MTNSAPDVTLLGILRRHRVRFVLVGGLAAVAEGAPITTFDTDIVPDRSPANIGRLIEALRELRARYRTRPELDRFPTADDLAGPGHHLLMTKLGALDVLGVIGKDRTFESIVKTARRRKIGDCFVVVLDLKTQIAVKKELGFAKDRLAIPILEDVVRRSKRSRRRR